MCGLQQENRLLNGGKRIADNRIKLIVMGVEKMSVQKISWPKNANCAALFTVNLCAEYFWLGMFPDSINRPKTLSMGQYGMKRGLKRVLDAFERYGIKGTFFIPGKVVEIYPDEVNEIVKKGHEIGLSGYEYENFASLTVERQEEALEKGIYAFKNVCNLRPEGFRAPNGEITIDTIDLLIKFGFKYSSSMFSDDRPYFSSYKPNQKDMLEIPIHWELNDFPLFAFNYYPSFPLGQGRISNYTSVLDSWINEYKAYYKYGLCYVTQFDPSTIGTPGRIRLLEELLDYIVRTDKVYIATCNEVADFCNNSMDKIEYRSC